MIYLFVPILLSWLTVLPFAYRRWRREQQWRDRLQAADERFQREMMGRALRRMAGAVGGALVPAVQGASEAISGFVSAVGGDDGGG